MEPGQVFCYKTTGELCIVIRLEDAGVVVRRPVMSHENGITHSLDRVAEFELESIEDHLRREAKEMVLKTKIQDEMVAELAKAQAAKPALELVN
jgi:hypothetical protein